MHPRHARIDDNTTDRRVIVVGDNGLTLRFIKHLIERYSFRVIAVFPDGPGGQREEIRKESEGNRNLVVFTRPHVTAETIREAGLTDAYAVALMDQNDVGNLHLALEIREMSHYLGDQTLPRLVIRMYNNGLRDNIQKLLGDDDDGVYVESDAEMVADTYALAALQKLPPGDIDIWDRRLYLTRRRDERAETQWLVASGNRIGVELIADDEAEALRYLCLAPDRRQSRFRPMWTNMVRRVKESASALRGMLNKSLVVLSIALLVVFVFGFVVLLNDHSGVSRPEGQGDVFYLLALLAGGGIDPDMQASGMLKTTYAVMTLSGSLLIPFATGAIVQAVVDRRYALSEGRRVRRVREHVIVIGLGNMGTRVVEKLRERKIPVVAIEQNRDAMGIQAARKAGAQVLLGDASSQQILEEADVAHCRSLVSMAKQDTANLEAALSGLQCNPSLRTVMRIYNPEFATLIRQNLNKAAAPQEAPPHASYSAPEVASASFAQRLTDDKVLVTIPVRGHIAYIEAFEIGEGSRLDDTGAHRATKIGSHRLLAVKRPGGTIRWQPDAGFRLNAGDTLLVLATRKGLNDILDDCRPGGAAW
ncbi:potassium channel family protein [Glycomyces harbinensis]|uniref:Trk K+ transport system, NAD-binding component n=1 Tax=Glycomyces harbinensis TaxID=58114 RepID=A0A1G7CJB9_9ACTN|nr:potassium channel protein [Glycomyces harbinensis]SDE39494.1 Trk K+ transport system, NAD-binding component [Glycomyces harbinensis]